MTLSPEKSIEILATDAGVRLVLRGAFTIANVTEMDRRLRDIDGTRAVRAELGGVTRIDTAGAWALVRLRQRVEESGQTFEAAGAPETTESLLRTVARAMPQPDTAPTVRASLADHMDRVGRSVVQAMRFLFALTGFLGLFLTGVARGVRHPSRFRLTALVHHCEDVGFRAVPIVALMSFLIGVVLAFQGATQLRQFGAEVFVVDLIAISILRELGVLLTSIIVAGRTASAFTAAIGSMKMREEIDAMRTLGLDPAMTLFVPRILALLFMLPILTLVSDIMGLFGGGLMAWVDLGISPAMFATRLVEGTDVSHLAIGMVKAPVFAIIIGVVGCHAGMQVGGNAELLGRMTSNAVVTAIFAVIVADAAFSIFFAQMGY